MTVATTYMPADIAFTHGEGIWLYDTKGKPYLDALCGIAVTGLGHAHPEVTETIQKQAAKLLHTSNAFRIIEQERLAEKMTKLTGLKEVFLANSGAEANETAFKLTRLFGHQKHIETPSVIVMSGAFHGRTLATLSATGNRRHQAGFEPLVPGFVRAPFNDIQAIETIAKNRKDIVAIMVEPIQGEGGIHVADEAYLHGLSRLCRENDWLLMFDEVQTGNGRTGSLYRYMDQGVVPDVLTTAKGLGNGVPIGACLLGERATGLFKPGSHGSTFGGNPLASATASTVLDVIVRDKLSERAHELGLGIKQVLQEKLGEHPMVKGIRGHGLMLGIELHKDAMPLKQIGLEEGIIFNVTNQSVVRMLPPLILKDEEKDELVSRMLRSLERFLD